MEGGVAVSVRGSGLGSVENQELRGHDAAGEYRLVDRSLHTLAAVPPLGVSAERERFQHHRQVVGARGPVEQELWAQVG